MKTINEAGWDRILRVLGGILLLALGFGGVVDGTLGLVFKIIGSLLLVTGLVGYCPVYSLLKVRTKK
ncbi:MAG: YgaP family membrane protein [Bellilinea sp.]